MEYNFGKTVVFGIMFTGTNLKISFTWMTNGKMKHLTSNLACFITGLSGL